MSTPARSPANGALAIYLPRLQLRLLRDEGLPQEGVPVRSFAAAVLLADLSGFSQLTQEYEHRGKAGAEELSGVLRRYFGRLAEIVLAHGGDLLTFAGDAALAMWPAESQAGLAESVRLARQAAVAIHRDLADDPEMHRGILQLRSAIACGTVYALHLGGAGGKWEFLVAGQPLREAGEAIRSVPRGRMAVGPSASEWLEANKADAATAGNPALINPQGIAADALGPVEIQADFALGSFLPEVLAERLTAGMSNWLSEFRNVTSIFAGFPDFREISAETLRGLQPVVRRAEELLQQYDGTLYQFLMDDKGLALIGIFGLPGQAHEDDALRAVQTATGIQAAAAALGMRMSVGVATGSSFCGNYGCDARRQYAVLGTAMNRAARLMEAAAGNVLCDDATAEQGKSRGELRFEQVGPLVMKGHSSPVLTYRPGTAVHGVVSDSTARATRPLQTGLVGRAREREALSEAVDALVTRRERGLIILEGQPGIGKSRLIEEVLQCAAAKGLTWLGGAGLAIEGSIPYHAWRPVFATVFGLANSTESLPRRQQRVMSYVRQSPELASLAPLLNVVLPIELPENDTTAELRGEARAERTRQLLLRVLELYGGQEPLLMILDDAHWFDSVSWTLARMATQRLPAMLCVLATRPTLDTPTTEYDELLRMPMTQRFRLDALPPENALQLACLRLGVTKMMQPIADYVLRQTDGTPLFVEELVYAMRDCGAIEVHDAECRLGPRMQGTSKSFEELFSELRLPGTVQGIVLSRIDRLPEPEQLLITIASVIGYGFSLATLEGIYPLEEGRKKLAAMAERLESVDLLRKTADGVYEFRHALIQEVVYDKIPFATRRELHQAVAEWYERSHADDLQNYYSLLGHHWNRAEVVSKAIEYLTMDGSRALKNFANLEAVRLFSEVIALDREHPQWSGEDEAAAQARRAHWQLQLGNACVAWSKYEEAREHLEHGLALAGRAMPSSMFIASLGLLVQVLRQAAIRVRGPKSNPLPEGERLRLLELTRAYEGLMEIYFLTDRPVPCLYSVFNGLNLAETAGPSPELARCYSSTGALVGFMAMRKWANGYFRLALDTARHTADMAAEAWVAMTHGVYLAGLADRIGAREQLLKSVNIYDRLGDSRHGDDARANLAASCHLHGEFAESLDLATRIYSSALLRRDGRVQAEATRWRAYNLIALSRIEEAQAAISELDSLRSTTMHLGGVHRKMDVLTLTGLLSLKRGNSGVVLEQARAALRETRSLSDSLELLMERAGIAEMYLSLWERGELPAKELRTEAAAAVKAIGKYASFFPVGKPAFLLYKGRLVWLMGSRAKAQELWLRACSTAESLGMPAYEALAHREIGQHLPAEDPSREEHLRRAQAILEGIASRSVGN